MGVPILGLLTEKELNLEEGVRETEEKHGWARNKPVGRDRFGRVRHEEDPGGTDDLLIPDYVMWDFGLPEKEGQDNGIRT